MRRGIRVCLVSPMPPPHGGIARWTEMIVRRSERRHDVAVTVVDTSVRWRTVHHTSLLRRALAGLPQLASSSLSLLRTMARGRPDVVHANTSGRLGVVRDVSMVTLARLFHVPFIYHIRFGLLPQTAAHNGLEWKAMAWIMRRAAAVIVLDGATEVALRQRIPDAPVTRIPNCVDVIQRPARACSSGSLQTVLFVGWVVPAKGVEDLLAAWSRLDAARTGWALSLAGAYDEAYLRALHDRLGSLGSVEFLGDVPHDRVLELMAGCDIFVLPSHTEGFPNAVLEAMAAGRAIISTHVGAISEMLADDCGVLVDPRDVDGLSTALRGLMLDASRREYLGDRAQARAASDYALDTILDRYVRLWSHVAGQGGTASEGHHTTSGPAIVASQNVQSAASIDPRRPMGDQ